MRSWVLIGLLFILKFEMAQVTSVEQEVKMGLVPVTEIETDDEWITVFTTVPVDLVSGESYIFLSPGATRVKRKIFTDSDYFYTREHDFTQSNENRIETFQEAVEILNYSQNGITSLGFKEAQVIRPKLNSRISLQELR